MPWVGSDIKNSLQRTFSATIVLMCRLARHKANNKNNSCGGVPIVELFTYTFWVVLKSGKLV